MITLASATGVVESLSKAYGPYAFGLVTTLVLLFAGVIVYVKVIAPVMANRVKIAEEDTKQAESLARAAESVKETARIQADTGEAQRRASEELNKLVERLESLGKKG